MIFKYIYTCLFLREVGYTGYDVTTFVELMNYKK
jgi:hypothetical protein